MTRNTTQATLILDQQATNSHLLRQSMHSGTWFQTTKLQLHDKNIRCSLCRWAHDDGGSDFLDKIQWDYSEIAFNQAVIHLTHPSTPIICNSSSITCCSNTSIYRVTSLHISCCIGIRWSRCSRSRWWIIQHSLSIVFRSSISIPNGLS